MGYTQGLNNKVIDRDNLLQYVTAQDLKAFGMIPEIIGRLPIITYLHPLDRSTLLRILTEPKNSIIKQYIKLFEMDGIKLKFEDEALGYIVDMAMEQKIGARGLRSIVESIMIGPMFELLRAMIISLPLHGSLPRSNTD